jgi:hypothetical protein
LIILLGNARTQVAVSFDFPRLRWLLAGMTVYILTVGLVNFVVLSGMQRVEWGRGMGMGRRREYSSCIRRGFLCDEFR